MSLKIVNNVTFSLLMSLLIVVFVTFCSFP